MRMRMLRGLMVAAVLFGMAGEASASRTRVSCEQQANVLGFFEYLGERLSGFWGQFLSRLAGSVAEIYADDCVHLNQVQVLGSHNSYHIEPAPFLIDIYTAFEPEAQYWEYSHRPLPEQFGQLGIRQIELDVYSDPTGSTLEDPSMFANPIGFQLLNADPEALIPELLEPGLKVLHVQELDWQSTCSFLVDCLAAIKTWSDANPRHLPIMVLIEVKDDPLPVPLVTDPPFPFDADAFDELDALIRSVFPPSQLITPDDVRGDFATLEEAATNGGWPTLGAARGRVLFGLDNRGKRDIYTDGRPNLEGRVLFTDGRPGEPDAAFVKENGPVGNESAIQDLIAAGYIVRTRADADTIESRLNDPTRREAALASAATFVSTDYEEPDPDFSPYFVEIPGDGIARCNPISAPPGCRDAALEP